MSLFTSAIVFAQEADQLKQRPMEAFKRFDAMTEDQRNSAVSNMSETDFSMVMLGAAQLNNQVNETIQAMAPPNTNVASIYELRNSNFTSSGNTSKASGISTVLSVNDNEWTKA